MAGRGRRSGTSTVAMMCRVGNDLCTAATAAVVIDRMELEEHEVPGEPQSSPRKLSGTVAIVVSVTEVSVLQARVCVPGAATRLKN